MLASGQTSARDIFSSSFRRRPESSFHAIGDAKLGTLRYWIPACAGMTVKGQALACRGFWRNPTPCKAGRGLVNPAVQPLDWRPSLTFRYFSILYANRRDTPPLREPE
ncbi:hypothetical protein GCM10027021_03840 [Dyella kyungheensis]